MERLIDVSCTVGESPLWHAAQAAWFWVDIPGRRVWRLDAATGATRYWSTSEMVACIAVRHDGGLIAGMESGIFALELGDAPAALERKLATPELGLGPGLRFNDGRCDRQGRFWAGTMFMDMSAARADGKLFRYDAQGLSAPLVEGLLTQNGLAFSPDGGTMYLSDSHPQRRVVWAYDYDVEAGLPHHRRVFVDMQGQAGRPDGAAIDANGCYWICGNDGGYIDRYTPTGVLDRRLEVPMLKPAMCSFGGKDMDTLMVTSIISGKPEDAQWGGAVILLRPGVQGVPETLFGA
ncbi:MAG: SMP-30/gluconolactonase/LRE family protein [Sphingomonadaceae bacterium]